MWFAFDLVDEGHISPAELVGALRRQLRCRRPIGQLAVDKGLMTMGQVFDVLASQAESEQPFGEWAIRRGYICRDDLAMLMLEQVTEVPSLEDVLVEMGAIDREKLDACLRRVRKRMGFHRERSFEVLSEAELSGL